MVSPCSDFACKTPRWSFAVDSSKDCDSPNEMTSARTMSPGRKEESMETLSISVALTSCTLIIPKNSLMRGLLPLQLISQEAYRGFNRLTRQRTSSPIDKAPTLSSPCPGLEPSARILTTGSLFPLPQNHKQSQTQRFQSSSLFDTSITQTERAILPSANTTGCISAPQLTWLHPSSSSSSSSSIQDRDQSPVSKVVHKRAYRASTL
mmetsp:Transcript_10329/g.29261  ORF Transcript_10329/g.29261 Transcript_10329/m.29261 type:complete len:207 (+) Transcript_10329:215-835(+)